MSSSVLHRHKEHLWYTDIHEGHSILPNVVLQNGADLVGDQIKKRKNSDPTDSMLLLTHPDVPQSLTRGDCDKKKSVFLFSTDTSAAGEALHAEFVDIKERVVIYRALANAAIQMLKQNKKQSTYQLIPRIKLENDLEMSSRDIVEEGAERTKELEDKEKSCEVSFGHDVGTTLMNSLQGSEKPQQRSHHDTLHVTQPFIWESYNKAEFFDV
ncbi:hypothetical protein STEG23_038205 [Scotinomys teguina]